MEWKIESMTAEDARHIAAWTYEPPYDFYSFDGSDEVQQEFLEQNYQVIKEGDTIIGYFCTGQAAQVPKGASLGLYGEHLIDIGLGMRPDLTGRGMGRSFLSFILAQVAAVHRQPLRLTVASFNQRAIQLYEALGFHLQSSFQRGETQFHIMVQES